MSALYGRYHGRILSLARVSTADGAWRSKPREILAEFDKERLHLPRPRPPPCEMSWQLRSSTRFCVFQMPKEAMLALPQEGSTVEEISIGTHARTITPLAKCMIGLRRGQITCATTSNYPCEYSSQGILRSARGEAAGPDKLPADLSRLPGETFSGQWGRQCLAGSRETRRKPGLTGRRGRVKPGHGDFGVATRA
jgi:hypothetical protein